MLSFVSLCVISRFPSLFCFTTELLLSSSVLVLRDFGFWLFFYPLPLTFVCFLNFGFIARALLLLIAFLD